MKKCHFKFEKIPLIKIHPRTKKKQKHLPKVYLILLASASKKKNNKTKKKTKVIGQLSTTPSFNSSKMTKKYKNTAKKNVIP